MRAEVSRIQRELGVTTVYVTHDQVEAMTMADRVAVLHKGVLQQIASPATLYDEPANLFVAGFLGSPQMSFVEAQVGVAADGKVTLQVGPQAVVLGDRHADRFPNLREMAGRRVALGIRPEDLHVVDGNAGHPDRAVLDDLPASVVQTEMLGADEVVYAELDASRVSAPQLRDQLSAVDPLAAGGIGPGGESRRALVVCRSNRRTEPVRRGDTVTLAVDLGRLYLFEEERGRSLRSPSALVSRLN
jgi:multiple sugar transport system ATP-binding protein